MHWRKRLSGFLGHVQLSVLTVSVYLQLGFRRHFLFVQEGEEGSLQP